MRRVFRASAVMMSLAIGSACAGLNLNAFVQPPRFEQADDRPAEIRLGGPSVSGAPGAIVRLWTKVTNPNAFGLTVNTLRGSLFLEDVHAADTEFPLGLPLGARQSSVVPIDISVRLSDLPALGNVARRVLDRQPVAYRLEGTIAVDAARIGQDMTFGPLTLLRGEARVPLGVGGFPR